jgi:chromosome segregation ATPase
LTFLTKLFVILLVFFSLLMTAATIVYVGKQDTRLATLEQTDQQLNAARSEAARAKAAWQAAEARAQAISAEAIYHTQEHGKTINQLQAQVADLNKQIAQLQSANAQGELRISNLTEAASAAQAMAKQLQETASQLRQSNDQMLVQSTEMNARISDLRNTLDVTERERRMLAEQLQLAQQQLAQAQQTLKEQGISFDTAHPVAAADAVSVNLPAPINGVIRQVTQLRGAPYGSISLGSADGVRVGMRFRIVSGDQFLGTLLVDRVEPHESAGPMDGPAIPQVQTGVRVESQ